MQPCTDCESDTGESDPRDPEYMHAFERPACGSPSKVNGQYGNETRDP
jgi:hypothetical protein